MYKQYTHGEPLFEPPNKFEIWMQEIGLNIIAKANSSKDCYICGTENYLEYHHIIPTFLGGLDIPENKTRLCGDCHDHLHNFNDHKWSERYGIDRLEKLRTKHLNSSSPI